MRMKMDVELDPKWLVLGAAVGAAAVYALGPGGEGRRRGLLSLMGRGEADDAYREPPKGAGVPLEYEWIPKDREALRHDPDRYQAVARQEDAERRHGEAEVRRADHGTERPAARVYGGESSSVSGDEALSNQVGSGPARSLTFPAGDRVGTLYMAERPERSVLGYAWQELGEARGTVTAPANKALRLDVYDHGDGKFDLSWLDKLDPNALHTLNLPKDRVRDADLEHVGRLRGLRHLDLSDTPITDDGLKHLQGLTNLENLNLSGTKITDDGLKYLAGMKDLETLHLWGTAVGDAGLAWLRGLSNLRELTLGETAVSDAGLANLAGLTKLVKLDLSATRVTDAGAAQLRGLPELKELVLLGTEVSGTTAHRLERDLPSEESSVVHEARTTTA